MLRDHPQILSLSEFYGIQVDGGGWLAEAFSGNRMDGRRFWDMVAEVAPFTTFCLRRWITCTEWLYPCDAPGARFSSQTGVPAILVTALPHLTNDHDALFNALESEVTNWPTAPIGEQYRRLFGWLAAHFRKQLWVERSGAGLSMIEPLLATFPSFLL
jgi:putative sulfotransferase